MQEIGINSTFKKLIYESLEMLADNTSTDKLKGFTEAIRAVFPESTKQICIVYQIRNSCRHLVCKDRKAFAVAMKSIYTSPNRKAAALVLDHLEAVWGRNMALFNHQLAQQLEGTNCILGFSPEIRKIIHTTTIIENLNGKIRKYTKKQALLSN